MRILVLSTFDIWPPQDGGQTRYYNIWTNFSCSHDIKILVYDFRQDSSDRSYRLSENVEVIVPAASFSDARHFHHMMGLTSLWLHDILCFQDYGFSESFLGTLRKEIADCEVLVASHPYLAPMAFSLARSDIIKVYESFNVEYDIKKRYFNDFLYRPEVAALLKSVKMVEALAARVAHHVTVVSNSDKDRMMSLYNLPPRKVSVVRNGANISATPALLESERLEIRRILGADTQGVGVFLGSAYLPNVKSYFETRLLLQSAGFRGTVLLVGTIDQADRAGWEHVDFRELWFGFVDEATKVGLLEASDFALQLIFDGAGTNLKLFDYINARLPILINSFGMRGVEENDWCWPVENATDVRNALLEIRSCESEVRRRTMIAHQMGLSLYDWKVIAANFEAALQAGFASMEIAQ